MCWLAAAFLALVASSAHATTAYIPEECGTSGEACLYTNVENVGSFQIDASGYQVDNGFGYNVTPPFTQIAARSRNVLGHADLFSLVLQHEAGGHNQEGDKTQGSALVAYASVGSSGEHYTIAAEARKAGTGDNVALNARCLTTGTTNTVGDEGTVCGRFTAQDYLTTPIGTVTFSGGSVETVVPSGLSEFEWDNIGEGNLIVWTDGQTDVNITNYNPTTRVWTYDSPANTDFEGKCFSVVAMNYTDEGAVAQEVWLYIDDDDTAGASTFRTQVRQVNGLVVGGPAKYTSNPASVLGAGKVAKACNRIAALNRDPNNDGNYADGTLTLVGGNWPNADLDTTITNPTLGSCASNCTFDIAGDPGESTRAALFNSTVRRGSLQGNYIIRVAAGASSDEHAAGIEFQNGTGVAGSYGMTSAALCRRSVRNCIEHVTTVNGAPNEAFARVEVVNNSGTDGFLPLFKFNENISGSIGTRYTNNLNIDLSSTNQIVGLGDSAANNRPIVTTETSGCSAGDVLEYGGGDPNRDWTCVATSSLVPGWQPYAWIALGSLATIAIRLGWNLGRHAYSPTRAPAPGVWV